MKTVNVKHKLPLPTTKCDAYCSNVLLINKEYCQFMLDLNNVV